VLPQPLEAGACIFTGKRVASWYTIGHGGLRVPLRAVLHFCLSVSFVQRLRASLDMDASCLLGLFEARISYIVPLYPVGLLQF
jgi:hypothetical protein